MARLLLRNLLLLGAIACGSSGGHGRDLQNVSQTELRAEIPVKQTTQHVWGTGTRPSPCVVSV